jgi:hypothetical protein
VVAGRAALDTVVLEVTESSEQGVRRNGVENLFAEAVNLGIVAVSKIYSGKNGQLLPQMIRTCG